MTNNQPTRSETLIEQLASGLKPVKRLRPPWQRFLLWLSAMVGIMTAEILITGSLRPGALHQLKESPLFFLQTALFFFSPVFCGAGAMYLSIPGEEGLARKFKWAGLLCLSGAVGLIIYSLWNPPIAPTWEGNRPFCMLHGPFFGLAPVLLLFFLLRSAAPLRWREASILAGLAAFLPVTATFQLACMYAPDHNLFAHVIPALIATLCTSLFGKKLLRKPDRLG